ncbi:DNA ligase [Marinobacter salicampi]|uniref:DNA ligase n=1 Tax=Marinobacter salicampi TaxID=435907 RepID=UPI0014076316|nr:DNA ligase [Marinobacter salicampi]
MYSFSSRTLSSLFVCFLPVLFLSFPLFVHSAPPKLLLAEVYEEGIELEHYWVSEKLDGVRAYWNGEHFLSKRGHEYKAPDWFTERFPGTVMDGELWMGRGRFAELSGVVRKQSPVDEEWREVRYMVFDLPASSLPFSGRVKQMRELSASSESSFLRIIEQRQGASHAELMTRLDQVTSSGGEGLMLHRGNSLYRAGRSSDVLKVKRYEDSEAVVIGHTEGTGKYEGMMGALVVELEGGRSFKIGTGFSDAERAAPPPIGAVISYKFYGLTSTGLPRFASFLRIRDDEPGDL